MVRATKEAMMAASMGWSVVMIAKMPAVTMQRQAAAQTETRGREDEKS
jgi:hypothetical protein